MITDLKLLLSIGLSEKAGCYGLSLLAIGCVGLNLDPKLLKLIYVVDRPLLIVFDSIFQSMY